MKVVVGRFFAALVALLLLTPWPAQSASITFVHSGTASGVLEGASGNTSFTDASFVITAVGDTDDKTEFVPGINYINHLSASIEIDGIGTLNFTTPTATLFDDGGVVSFSLAGPTPAGLLVGPELSGWDMLTSVGPVTGTAEVPAIVGIGISTWEFFSIMTSGGALIFFVDPAIVAAFQAAVEATPAPTPLPAALPLFATGLGAIGFFAWRRKRTAASAA